MACYRTFYVYKGTDEKTREPIQVPCGWCIGCRLDKAKQWAVRCTHEAQLYEQNSFVTLTYDQDNLPEDSSITKKHISKFMKDLRGAYVGKTIRFYACGEYGSKHNRPHYHICLFNHDFEDKEIKCITRKEKPFNKGQYTNPYTLYNSKELTEIWGKGITDFGEVTLESAGYVARYCVKKITGKKAEEHYQGKEPEFALMSRRPGIGAGWLKKYRSDVFPKDYFTMNGVKIKPPRYYDDILKRESPEIYDQIKDKREFYPKKEISSLRRQQMERHKQLIIQRTLERKYEI